MSDFVKHLMWYTVWDAKNGAVVAAGTAEMCAQKLGYKNANSFASAASHSHDPGVAHRKYLFYREYLLRSEVDFVPPPKRRGKDKAKRKPAGAETPTSCRG